jgi:hypothetical protein
VATEATHLRIVEQLIPTTFEDSDPAYLLAAAATTRYGSGDLCATNAESPDADEHSVSECDQDLGVISPFLWFSIGRRHIGLRGS